MQIIFDEIELILRLGLDVPQQEEPFSKSKLLPPDTTQDLFGKIYVPGSKKQGLFMLSLPLHFQYIPNSISPRFGQSDLWTDYGSTRLFKEKLCRKTKLYLIYINLA